ncbi:hypothetical protein [Halodesulfovibrio sp.]|uniref:hypothetical protein n=1 Tax=Halodesulfovibrio sp. TaxID=1912772 RepID=UPI0025C4AA9E|nr:hypothetical protein [Halodesulfovibrio sp.]
MEELDCEGHDDTVNCIVAALRAGLGKADYARRGHIVGVVRFSKSIENPAFDMNADAQAHVNAASIWANSDSHFWWKIEKAKPITPVSAKGRLSFWKFDYPHPEELEGF